VIIANEKIMPWVLLPGCLIVNISASLFLRTYCATE
jgi:hypothetical protein